LGWDLLDGDEEYDSAHKESDTTKIDHLSAQQFLPSSSGGGNSKGEDDMDEQHGVFSVFEL
jgi:hypothetical protein